MENALTILIQEGTFWIVRIEYDQRNFGNICVMLRSKNQVDIRFVKDRSDFWCELGHLGEWYFVEDVFALIGVVCSIRSNDLYEFMEKVAFAIKYNATRIFDAFATDNFPSTQTKIKEMATKRAMNIFN